MHLIRSWNFANHIAIVLSLFGLFIAGILLFRESLPLDIGCNVQSSCRVVSSSPASQFFGIPVSAYGSLLCLMLLILGLLRFGSRSLIANTTLAYVLLAVGVLISFLLLGYSIFYLNAICIWCVSFLVILLLNLSIHARLYVLRGLADPRGSICEGLASTLVVLGLGSLSLPLWRPDTSHAQFDGKLARSLTDKDLFPFWAPTCGDPSAKTRFLMFGDFSCLACAESFPRLVNAVQSRKGVSLTFRHFANLRHSGSLTAAIVLQLAAEEGSFWQLGLAVFESGDYRRPGLDEIASKFGLTRRRIEIALLKEPQSKYRTWVQSDRSMALRLGLDSTPSILLFEPNRIPRLISSKDAITLASRL